MEVNMNPDVIIARIVLGWYGGVLALFLVVGGFGLWYWKNSSNQKGDDTEE